MTNDVMKERFVSPDAEAVATAVSMPRREQVIVAGIPVDNVTEDEAAARIENMISEEGSHYMAVVNASKVVAAQRDRALRNILVDADLLTADGMSVVWAARMLGHPLRGRVTGIDLFERLVGAAAKKRWPIYLLGGAAASIEGTVAQLKARHAGLIVAGHRDGYFEASESGEIAEGIKNSGAYLLFVGMGSPRQEKWISENLSRTGARFALGVGGTFDHVSGLSRRAPGWMQQGGLEWLYRLAREPRRLWRRYLVGNALFGWLIIKQALSRSGRTATPSR
ncbi:MAG: glycosyltransferase [Blastocatellia bacterium AA13]|nr:MAG: glycosyltransferase [Blastocatellia bacterium AA13]